MGAEVDALCGAAYAERSPDWLLQPRRRAEQAFVSVIADAYLAGVSTRRVEKLVQQLGVQRMSKSQVSRLAKSLDQIVEDFRTRPLDGAPYPYVTFDALVVKCREGGRTVNVCVVHAVGVNRDGFRESLGLDVVTAEDGAGWLAFLRSLVARGLAGVRLVTSDAHPGLVDAIAATLVGAGWQRCRTHAMRNLLTRVPKSAQSFVATMVRTIFAQPDAQTVHEQHRRIVDQLEQRFPEAAALLAAKGSKRLEHAVVVNKALNTGLGLERYYHYQGEQLGAGMQHLVNVASGNSIVRWTPFGVDLQAASIPAGGTSSKETRVREPHRRVRRGDATPAELGELYRRRFDPFVRVAVAICGDGEAGRDVVQLAFATAIRRRRSFRCDGPLEAWVWRIVVNEARRAARAPRDGSIESLSLERDTNGRSDDPYGVRALVAGLPGRQREVLFLRYYADLEYHAIADVLEIEPGTVAATLSAAHQTLRRRLEGVRR